MAGMYLSGRPSSRAGAGYSDSLPSHRVADTSRVATTWGEEEPRGARHRVAQPSTKWIAPQRIGSREHRLVALDPATRRHRVGQDEKACDGERSPTETFGSEPSCETALDVVPPECLFDGRDLGLDLGDQEGRGRLMPGERIDGPAVAVHGERHLQAGDPAPLFECCSDPADKTCVTRIQKSIEFAASPTDGYHEISVKVAEDATEHADAQVLDRSAFESRHASLAHGRAPGDVNLTPAKALTEGTRDPANAEVAH